MLLAPPRRPVEPGVDLHCYGPVAVPVGARELHAFQPKVNMGIVHHLIITGGAGWAHMPQASVERMGAGSACARLDSYLYAWARTGQQTPIGLDYRNASLSGAGFAVGRDSGIQWLALHIHYQQTSSSPVVDGSGVQLTFSSAPPAVPISVNLLLSMRLIVPARTFYDECVPCRVTRGGHVISYRVHAHRLSRDIWADHFDASGHAQPSLGRISAQEPQIFRHMRRRELHTGDTLLLHCQYDARAKQSTTHLGLDERDEEMCNQYLVADAATRIDCDASGGLAPSASFASAFAAHRLQLGQVTAAALDEDGQSIYLIHRGPNNFASSAPLAEPAIHRFSRDMSAHVSAVAPRTFTVPHGLSFHQGHLWATDVGSHQVFKLDRAGVVRMRLGDGRRGGGRTSFDKPTSAAVHPTSGEIYVSDGYGNSRIVVFSPSGTFAREWGSRGRGPGQFHVPHSIALDGAGTVYVADRENSRIQLFGESGSFVAEWPSRVAASTRRGAVYSHHLSSVSFNAQLDALVAVEGHDVTLRHPRSGCVLSSTRTTLAWPHHAIVVPLPRTSHAGRASASPLLTGELGFAVYVAELDGHRLWELSPATPEADDRPSRESQSPHQHRQQQYPGRAGGSPARSSRPSASPPLYG